MWLFFLVWYPRMEKGHFQIEIYSSFWLAAQDWWYSLSGFYFLFNFSTIPKKAINFLLCHSSHSFPDDLFHNIYLSTVYIILWINLASISMRDNGCCTHIHEHIPGDRYKCHNVLMLCFCFPLLVKRRQCLH